MVQWYPLLLGGSVGILTRWRYIVNWIVVEVAFVSLIIAKVFAVVKIPEAP